MPYILQNAYCNRGIEGAFAALDEALAVAKRLGFDAWVYQGGLWVASFSALYGVRFQR